MTTRWYSMDSALETVDHEVVDLDAAYRVIDEYFSKLRPHYDTGEEALAETMFGFSRDDGSYMQICLHAPDLIDIEYDFSIVKNPILRAVGRRQAGERLHSRDEVRARAKAYFTESREQFRETVRSSQ
jgi:hypothetical protein